MCSKSWPYQHFRDANQTKNVKDKISNSETLKARGQSKM